MPADIADHNHAGAIWFAPVFFHDRSLRGISALRVQTARWPVSNKR